MINFGNEKGFALIQVVIASAIFTFLALAMSTLVSRQREAVMYLEDQLEKIQLSRNIETILKDGISCQKTLNGTLIPPRGRTVGVPVIRDNTGAPVYRSNSDSGNLRIGDIRVLNQSVSGVNSSGFVEIQIPISRVRKGGGPSAFQTYKSKLTITVNSSRRASSCLNPSSLEDVLKTTKAFETTDCSRTDGILEVVSNCGQGYSLLSCSGGPGDQDESSEGWFMVPNFSTNSCKLRVQRPRCSSGEFMTFQRSTAICYRNSR